jgi:hypothetical protein
MMPGKTIIDATVSNWADGTVTTGNSSSLKAAMRDIVKQQQ